MFSEKEQEILLGLIRSTDFLATSFTTHQCKLGVMLCKASRSSIKLVIKGLMRTLLGDVWQPGTALSDQHPSSIPPDGYSLSFQPTRDHLIVYFRKVQVEGGK